MKRIVFIALALLVLTTKPARGVEGFTQEDRERLIRLETTLQEDRERLIRLETTLQMFVRETDKRFEQVDKRFEQVDKRFEQMMANLWMLAAVFSTFTIGVIGFAFWDRRTVIRRAREETVAAIEGEGRLNDVIYALREQAKANPEIAEVLRNFHLL